MSLKPKSSAMICLVSRIRRIRPSLTSQSYYVSRHVPPGNSVVLPGSSFPCAFLLYAGKRLGLVAQNAFAKYHAQAVLSSRYAPIIEHAVARHKAEIHPRKFRGKDISIAAGGPACHPAEFHKFPLTCSLHIACMLDGCQLLASARMLTRLLALI